MSPDTTSNPYSGYQDLSQGPAQSTVTNPLFAGNISNSPATVASTPKQSGNFWSRVGGIALPVLGALLAPETGGASLLASTALSGIGGIVGKAADNATAGQNPFQANDLEAGLTNAAGNIIGGGLVKGAGKIAKGIIAPMADKVGASLVAGQGKGALDNTTAQYLYNNGIQDLRDVGKIAPIVTGSEGAFTNAVNNSLLNAADTGTRIDLSSLAASGKGLPGEAVQSAIDAAGIGGDTTATNSVQKFIQGQLRQFNPKGFTQVPVKGGGMLDNFDNGVLNAQHPLDTLSMTKNMDKTAADWLSSKSPTIQAQGRALRNISNNLKDNLYGEGTSIGQTGITDQVRQQAIADLEPLKEINPQYYETKVGEINGAKTLGDLRTAQKPDVLASQALDTANHVANTSGGASIPDLFKVGAPIAGMSVGGPVGLAAGLIAPKVLGSEGASVAGAKTASKLSKLIGNEKAGKVMNTLGRISGVTAANVPGMGAQPTNQSILSGLPQEGNTMNPMQTTQPSQLEQLLQAMQAQSILAPSLNPGSTSLLSSFAPQLQQNQLLKNGVSALSSEFNNAGGAQGLSGIGSVLSGFVPGTAANAYQGDVKTLAAQLAKTLGISEEAAQNLLPGLLQNQETAGQRQSVLGGLVGNLPS